MFKNKDNKLWHRKEIHLTVCIAAICEGDGIYCAADRMLGAGDIEFEPPIAKIYRLNGPIVILTAGDSGMHSEIFQEVSPIVNKKLKQLHHCSIKEVALLYNKHYNLIRSSRAEMAVLQPLGLSLSDYIKQQKQMNDEFVTLLSRQIQGFPVPDIRAIIAGHDYTGSHIYVVNGVDMTCADDVGFTAIGIGAKHAESQFMLAGHSPKSEFDDTILLTYFAKKRAEVAPGVGTSTDMIMIAPSTDYSTYFTEEVINGLEIIYQQYIKDENDLREKIKSQNRESFRKFLADE